MHQEDDRLRAVAPMQAEGRETKTQRQAENQNQGASLIAQETGETVRRMELERVALLAFLRRLLDAFGGREGAWAEGLLPRASADELDRLVGVAMAVIQEEAKGR